MVNGQDNPNRTAGGPNVSTVAARSAKISEGIKLTLPPWSASFILCEGEMELYESTHQLSFEVLGRLLDQVNPLEAVVKIDNRWFITNSTGEVDVDLEPGFYDYSIFAEGHIQSQGSIVIDGDKSLRDTLDAQTYTAEFLLSYSNDSSAINQAVITLGSTSMTYNSEGNTIFTNVREGSHELLIEVNNMEIEMEIFLESDSTFHFLIDPPMYELEFLIEEMFSERVLAGVKINVSGESDVTDLSGIASLSLQRGSHSYAIQLDDYEEIRDTIFLDRDSTLSHSLTALLADVKIKLFKESTPVNNISISIGSETEISNSLGMSTFRGLETGITHQYTIESDDYLDLIGEFFLRVDTSIVFEMTETGLTEYTEDKIRVYPNPVENELRIHSSRHISEIRLVSITGQSMIRILEAGSGEHLVPMKEIPKGLYFLQVTDNHNKTSIVKLVKQ